MKTLNNYLTEALIKKSTKVKSNTNIQVHSLTKDEIDDAEKICQLIYDYFKNDKVNSKNYLIKFTKENGIDKLEYNIMKILQKLYDDNFLPSDVVIKLFLNDQLEIIYEFTDLLATSLISNKSYSGIPFTLLFSNACETINNFKDIDPF